MKLYVAAPMRDGTGEGLAASQRLTPVLQSPVIPARASGVQSFSAMKDWWSPQLLTPPR
jgi:hypothetical protein